MYSLLADALVVVHLLFIVFVVAGGVLVIRWPKAAFIHLPAAVWGAVVEFTGWICPLTPLENTFRNLAGADPYSGDFIERYLIPVIYPANLTAETQYVLGMLVVIVNILFYGIAIGLRIRKRRFR